MIELCKKHPKNCFPMMGLHPCDVKIGSMERELSHVEEMLQRCEIHVARAAWNSQASLS